MKIMISAGEVSGDVHGSHLVRELKKLNPNIYFFGMGSEKLLLCGKPTCLFSISLLFYDVI
ncbi:MAG: hypothetical protein ABIH69_03710 [bacterium]